MLTECMHAPAQVQLLDAKGLKRLILSFERKVRGRCTGYHSEAVCCMHAGGANAAVSAMHVANKTGEQPCRHALRETSGVAAAHSRLVATAVEPYQSGTLRCPAQYKENLEMRMKHADDPQKFLASEVDLDEEVHR